MELAKFIPCWLLIFAMGMSLCSGDEVDTQLKRLNKPYLKSIQSPDGDTIDCVPISQQIAFDHPSLKNHIIQMVPSSFPKGLSKKEELVQLWNMNEMCPKETIPVRRTKREDILRAVANNQGFGTKDHESIRIHETDPPAATATHESPDGDTIDCVPISQQIAFDHPSLKNHIIQMVPSSFPKGFSNEEELVQLWNMNGTCPKETIPVTRTKKEDIVRAEANNQGFGTKDHKSIRINETDPPAATATHEYAVAKAPSDAYYGAEAIINTWNPYVMSSNEFSLSQFWLVSGYGSGLNTIETGWQKFPQLYGDYNTRFFIYWTRDGYGNTGCYNLLCSGFIQIDRTIVIGGSMKVSTYNGVQYEMTVLAYKDPKTGNWWLKVGPIYVGYWPARIFTALQSYATRVEWGGEIINYKSGGLHTTTAMGSGHFPYEGYSKASYFKQVRTVDASYIYRSPRLTGYAIPSANCYNIQIGTDPSWGNYFYYGGYGRNSLCP